MTASFFLTVCLGGVVSLTPLAVYLVWIVTINRKARPTVVGGVWDFVGLLAGMSGFLFCLGVMIAGIAADARWITGGRADKIPSHMPWLSTVWLVALSSYLLLIAGLVLRGLRLRKDSLIIYNADLETVEGCIADAFVALDRPAVRRGWSWFEGDLRQIELAYFTSFRHATVNLTAVDDALREELERTLRAQVPRQPAASSNTAVQWISTVMTCSMVAVGCCVVLIFAVPFVRDF